MFSSLRILQHQMKFERHTARVWLGIGMGMALCVHILVRVSAYSAARGEPVNVMEGFLYCVLEPQNMMLLSLGYLFLISDAPFVNEQTLQVVVRTQRRAWNTGCLLYIVAQACFYYLALLGFSMLLLGKHGYIGMAWSIPTVQASQNINVIISNFRVSFPYWEFIQENTVISAVALTLWGNILYSSMLGGILYLGNLGSRYSLGTWMAIVVHFSGYITRREWNGQWSLQTLSSPAENDNFCPFYIIFLVIALASYWRAKRMDYHIVDKDT